MKKYDIDSDVLLEANIKLEQDLISCYDVFNSHEKGHLLWSCTYKDLRADDLKGLIVCYYKDREQPKGSRLRTFIAPLKILKPFFRGLFLKSSKAKEGGSYWVMINHDEKKHRYKHLLDELKSDNTIFCFGKSFSKRIKVNSFVNLDFSRYSKISDALLAFKIAMSLKKHTKKITDTSYLAKWIKSTPWTHYFNMALKEIWIERVMKAHQPKAIFYTTANNYPPARILSRLSKLNGIPFVLVACRQMFVETRPEERACSLDIDEVNDSRIADYWVVWDEFSRTTLSNVGVSKNKVFVSLPKRSLRDLKHHNEDYLLLLTHDSQQNDLLIDLWTEVAMNARINFSIRKHPSCDLTDVQHRKLSVFTYSDISNLPMYNYDLTGVIAVSINSTAAIEVIGLGGGVLWLPFLNDKSVVFQPIFNIIGLPLHSKMDLINTLERLKIDENRKELINACSQSYHNNFYAEDETDLFFKQLNN